MDSHRTFFEGLANEWGLKQPLDRVLHLNSLIDSKLPDLSKSRNVLVVGSGTGILTPILTQRYPKLHVVSIDFAWMMISHPENVPNSIRLQTDVHALPFTNMSFDGVICHNSFPHFQDHPLAMREMGRVLKANAPIMVLHDINREMVNHVHVNASSEIIHQDILPDTARFQELMKYCGLRKVQVSEGNDYFLAVGYK